MPRPANHRDILTKLANSLLTDVDDAYRFNSPIAIARYLSGNINLSKEECWAWLEVQFQKKHGKTVYKHIQDEIDNKKAREQADHERRLKLFKERQAAEVKAIRAMRTTDEVALTNPHAFATALANERGLKVYGIVNIVQAVTGKKSINTEGKAIAWIEVEQKRLWALNPPKKKPKPPPIRKFVKKKPIPAPMPKAFRIGDYDEKRALAKKYEFYKSKAFLRSPEWKRLRYKALELYGRRCMCCGATPADGYTIVQGDHIKDRHNYPELALDINNVQILCGDCNLGKGNDFNTDWRTDNDKKKLEEDIAAYPEEYRFDEPSVSEGDVLPKPRGGMEAD